MSQRSMPKAIADTSRIDGSNYLERFRRGEWRAPIFRDIVLDEMRAMRAKPTLLDIGCGKGFDGEYELQKSLADASGSYIGIEPDLDIPLAPHFTETHRCAFEDAPLAPGSVDLAFAVMVLEHVANPEAFWNRVLDVLADGGIFWGFTVDARHYFCRLSLWMERFGLKNLYLNCMFGRRGSERYENYPVRYAANAPEQIRRFVGRASSCDFLGFSKVGQIDSYLPKWIHPFTHGIDRRAIARNRPGSLLTVRIRK
jgi:SAM-dependent methyltransferase